MSQKNRDRSLNRGDRIGMYTIVTAFLLCILISGFGFLENRDGFLSAAQTAAQTAARTINDVQLSDPLLVLVNDRTPIPEDWKVTPRMVDDEQVDQRMYKALTDMFAAAAKDNVWFWVASGYRSVEDQEEILERAVLENTEKGMTEQKAREEALRTIQRPGYSEHHTGLAVDLNDVSDNFEKTEAYRWLSEHGAEYGFVQRYKSHKTAITGIDRESWHYRYVGKEHAMAMERLDLCLEEYVDYLRERGAR